MNLLLDSTVFWQDPNFKSGAWIVLQDYVRRTGAVVFVPAVVVDEIREKFEQRLLDAKKEVEDRSHKVGRLIEKEFPVQNINVREECRAYTVRLKAKLEENFIKVLDYPNTSHSQIVRRQLASKRPFQPRGSGYRDYLIWTTLMKELVRWPKDCVIVTNNTDDFSQDKERPHQLHSDLLEDLDSARVDARVAIARNLDEFLDKHARPKLKRLYALTNKIQSKKIINIPNFLSRIHERILVDLNEKPREFLRLRRQEYHRLEDPIGIAYLDKSPLEFRVKDVRKLSERENVVTFTATYDGELFGHISDVDAMSLRPESPFFIVDPDWENSTVRVGANITVEIEFRLVYKTRTKKIVGWEILIAQTDADNYLSRFY